MTKNNNSESKGQTQYTFGFECKECAYEIHSKNENSVKMLRKFHMKKNHWHQVRKYTFVEFEQDIVNGEKGKMRIMKTDEKTQKIQ